MYIRVTLKLRFSNFNMQKNPLEALLKSPRTQSGDSASADDFGVKCKFSEPLSEKDHPVELGVTAYC